MTTHLLSILPNLPILCLRSPWYSVGLWSWPTGMTDRDGKPNTSVGSEAMRGILSTGGLVLERSVCSRTRVGNGRWGGQVFCSFSRAVKMQDRGSGCKRVGGIYLIHYLLLLCLFFFFHFFVWFNSLYFFWELEMRRASNFLFFLFFSFFCWISFSSISFLLGIRNGKSKCLISFLSFFSSGNWRWGEQVLFSLTR